MIDLSDYLRFLLALLFVLGLIGGLTLLARRFAPRFMGLGLHVAPRGTTRRLGVVETLQLDPRRRLILVRLDGREHLLLLGPERETIVESRAASADGAPPLMSSSATAVVPPGPESGP